MVTEPPNSDLADPLHGDSALFLLPRLIRVSKDAPHRNPDHPDDLESIHNYMKSTAFRRPHKLVEDTSNSKFPSFAASETNNEDVAAKGKKNPQERRPALGRKKARFSMKPNASQPSASLEPILDIDHIQDPEEYFLAYEKFENARKEIQKQRGDNLTDSNQYNPSTNARHRRPGLLGKSGSYRHQYSAVLSKDDKIYASSQETLQENLLQLSNHDLSQETTGSKVRSQDKEEDGSVSETENRVGELLDEYLSSNNENMDALTFLKERMHIDIDLIHLPDFNDIGRTGFASLGGKLPKTRQTLSDIHNLVRGSNKRSPVKHKRVANSPVHAVASRTPLKSPFSSLLALKKRVLQSKPLSDPFSALNIDISPARRPSFVHFDRELDPVDTRKELSSSDELKSLGQVEITKSAYDETGLENAVGEVLGHLVDRPLNDSPSRPGVAIGVSSLLDADDAVRAHASSGIEVENMLLEATSSARPDTNTEDSPMENWNNIPGIDLSSPTAVEDHPMEGPSTTSKVYAEPVKNSTGIEDNITTTTTQEVGLEEHNEEFQRIPSDGRSKEKRPCKGNQRKMLSRRQSLAGAGTFWNSGIRRSSRIKMRPLEYWKGERFLYGRVHESLTTVIGCKYISPGKGKEGRAFRVKSFVSDEHKELVELASLH